jgi:hypothetical protein
MIEHLTPAEKLMLIEHLARSLRDVPTQTTLIKQQMRCAAYARNWLPSLPTTRPMVFRIGSTISYSMVMCDLC